MYTVKLHQASQEHKRRIGSKALQLARLTELNIAIPDGFVITAEALDRFFTANGLHCPEERGDIENQFRHAAIPEEIQQEVVASLEQLKKGDAEVAVAVRSSCSAEDLQEASFAGQYETILNVTDLPHLLESIKRCWASLFSSRVKTYVQQKKLDSGVEDASMGVLIQLMVQADVSGVIFSIDPVAQNRDEIVINASYGLGESIVSGIVTPDAYFVSKSTGNMQKVRGLKERKIIAAEQETVEVETTEEEQNQYCLTDEQVSWLAEETRKIESFFGIPVDIEFAVKDDRGYILQARPITA